MDKPKRPRKAESEPKVADKPVREQRPSLDPEGREKQLMNLAYDLAEKQLKDGTASPSVIGHFLKLSTKREALEQDMLEKQSILMQAKTENIHKGKEIEEMTIKATDAIGKYRSSSMQ